MPVSSFQIAPGIRVGDGEKLLVIAGPCVIESENICRSVAVHLKGACDRLGLPYVFKASFDKANRTSGSSFRGPGIDKGLEILKNIKAEVGVPVLTDVHTPEQTARAAEVVDVLQIPAFLCRQTDLLAAAGRTGKPVNIKKGQFMAPGDMCAAIDKVRAQGAERVLVTERGTTFGYRNLVVDMRGLVTLAELEVPVVFDGTHSVQLPGGQGNSSGGDRQYVFPLARAAAAVGIHALFLEVHPDPDNALCDGPNSLPLSGAERILEKVAAIHELVRKNP